MVAGAGERAGPLGRSAAARGQAARCQRGRARLILSSRGDQHDHYSDHYHEVIIVIIMMRTDHLQVVQFLRQCPDTVSLELYRDASRSQTPLSPEQVCSVPSPLFPLL